MTDLLDDLLQKMPSDGASEAEIEAFMEKVMATPGGAELIQDFAKKITAGGSLDTMLKEEEAELESFSFKSPARFIFRIEILGTKPLVWRRLSLPADCSYFHLHAAIQDAFGWTNSHEHRFEVWEDGELELVFSSADDDHYCEVENRVGDLFRENVSEFRYLYRDDHWPHRVVIEDLVSAGEKGSSSEVSPKLHDGKGHGPPEDCGGVTGFVEFLKGEHPLCEKFEEEVLAEFCNGKPDIAKVIFRDVSKFPRR